MSFIKPREHNIVMDLGIPLDAMKRLHDAGVTAAIEFVDWNTVEPTRGVYDWHHPDAMVDKCRAAGMKAILLGLREGCEWMPDYWFVRGPHGLYRRTVEAHSQVVWGHLSPWNDEACAYQQDAARLFCERYAASDVICMASLGRDAEALIPAHYTTLYDPFALADYRAYTGDEQAVPDLTNNTTQQWLYGSLRKHAADVQRVYMDAHPERTIFTALHPAYETRVQYGGAYYVHDMNVMLRPSQLVVIIWDYYSDGTPKPWMPAAHSYARCVIERDGADVWVGSEYPEGLATNTPRAIADRFNGLITAPLHPLRSMYWQIEPWVYDAFAASAREWQGAVPC